MTPISVALRKLVQQRAGGACEYCGVPENVAFARHEVDHIVAIKHGGLTEEANLALSCAVCNKHKGTDLASLDPATGALAALFHPRRDVWNEHFDVVDLRVVGRSPSGRVTEKLLQLNRPERVRERVALARPGLWRAPSTSGKEPSPR